jgi:uncharacterized membrane protein SpoIIM required for sporulation
VDIDRYMALNESTWLELDALVDRAGAMGSRLTPPEVERLLLLYQRASAHLSYVHTNFNDPALSARLSRTVGSASAVIYSTPARAGRAIARFFTHTFPAAVWHGRRFVVISALLFFLPAIAMGAWFANSDDARDVAISPELQRAYLEEEFEDYYSSEAAAAFSTKVLVNNIQVSFLAFVGGIAFCLPTIWLLILNGTNIGAAAGLFHSAGRWPKFYGLILPHGVLELSAIVVAGAAGLSLGWALVAPGEQTRARALAHEGRRAVTILIGLILAFVVAGIIEGFVTPSGLPTAMRVGIGVVVGLTFWCYIVVLGRNAVASGHTGAFDDRR